MELRNRTENKNIIILQHDETALNLCLYNQFMIMHFTHTPNYRHLHSHCIGKLQTFVNITY